jgi:hypothetical protein
VLVVKSVTAVLKVPAFITPDTLPEASRVIAVVPDPGPVLNSSMPVLSLAIAIAFVALPAVIVDAIAASYKTTQRAPVATVTATAELIVADGTS